MYENGKMRPHCSKKGGIRENDGGVNLTKIHCKHFCAFTKVNVPITPVQQYCDNEKQFCSVLCCKSNTSWGQALS
jgi:hypothetical protein